MSGAICRKPAAASAKKKAPTFEGAFLREKILFAEERFDIQSLPLQNFPQTTQTFHLDLTHTLAGEANFHGPHLSRVAAS